MAVPGLDTNTGKTTLKSGIKVGFNKFMDSLKPVTPAVKTTAEQVIKDPETTTGPTEYSNMQAAQAALTANQYTQHFAEQQMKFQQMSANKAMRFNAEQAQLNRDWQEKMSNTAYQRAVKDLKAAGLNPILAYQQGGASVGSGATAQGYAMSGSGGQGIKAQTFEYEWTERIFQILCNSAETLLRNLQK